MTEPMEYLPVGKWNEDGLTHPLIYHLIDSSSVAHILWEEGLTASIKQQLSHYCGLPLSETGRLFAFYTSLHDIGKATPAFQKNTPVTTSLEQAGMSFPSLAENDIRHHSLLGAWILPDFQGQLSLSPGKAFKNLRIAIGGHHGRFPTNSEIDDPKYRKGNLGSQSWQTLRTTLFTSLGALLSPPVPPVVKLNETGYNVFFSLLTGFFVISDWLSSQDNQFPYHPEITPLKHYQQESLGRAKDALKRTGWLSWKPDPVSKTFSELFKLDHPTELQSSVFSLTAALTKPYLLILEAPTGCGKTEAALFAADQWIRKNQSSGAYIAMPTQATSNQMFGRVKGFLSNRYPSQNINLQLVHGNSILNEELKSIKLTAIEDGDPESGHVNAMTWFLPRKRTLLSPFGVGTVDQTFLAVLQTKHFFLRLFGLSTKVIIFDEVHAYDVYMVELFKRLLGWLRAIGCPVIILTATLPAETREDLLLAYDPNARVNNIAASFPRLSLNTDSVISTHSLPAQKDRTVVLEKITRRPEDLIALLRQRMNSGGCAAVICNTVKRSQELYEALRAASLVPEEYLHLFHSQFPYCWRKDLEDRILSSFGKLKVAATFPRRGIVVATQVIEQSLDLDFDLLVTDLPPVDLLVQRIGRLHRHTHSQYPPMRPAELREPHCIINMPDEKEGTGFDFGSDTYVYDEYFLLKTVFAIRNRNQVCLPGESDGLIEQVYSPPPFPDLSPALQDRLLEKWKKVKKAGESLAKSAQNRMIGDVDDQTLLGAEQINLSEDDQQVHKDLQALTRDTQPSITLVCLDRPAGDADVTLVSDGMPLDINLTPDEARLEAVLKSIVSVSDRRVLNHFYNQPKVEAWKKIPQLRNAWPVTFVNGHHPIDDHLELYLDPKIGLVINGS